MFKTVRPSSTDTSFYSHHNATNNDTHVHAFKHSYIYNSIVYIYYSYEQCQFEKEMYKVILDMATVTFSWRCEFGKQIGSQLIVRLETGAMNVKKQSGDVADEDKNLKVSFDRPLLQMMMMVWSLGLSVVWW